MTEMKSFRVRKKTDPPIPFTVELETGPDTNEYDTHKFHAKPEMRGATILDLVASGSIGSEWQAAALRKFFSEAVVTEEVEAFMKLLDESDPPIELEQLVDISTWLTEQYGNGRPTANA